MVRHGYKILAYPHYPTIFVILFDAQPLSDHYVMALLKFLHPVDKVPTCFNIYVQVVTISFTES